MENEAMAMVEALPVVEAGQPAQAGDEQATESPNTASEVPARPAFVKYDMDKHYQCYKCGDMFDKKSHARLGTPKRPFVMKELCPKCYAESNIARSRDVDALSSEVAGKYGLAVEAGKAYVEGAVRSKSQ